VHSAVIVFAVGLTAIAAASAFVLARQARA
jgi:hypothetical protein